MGTPVDLGRLYVDPVEGVEYARKYDPLGTHLNGRGNALLPPDNASGAYVLAKVMGLLMGHPDWASVQCSDRMEVRWVRPLLLGAMLYVDAEISTPEVSKREGIFTRTTLARAYNEAGEIAMLMSIRHYVLWENL
jgi:acyl dehydratase